MNIKVIVRIIIRNVSRAITFNSDNYHLTNIDCSLKCMAYILYTHTSKFIGIFIAPEYPFDLSKS